MDEPVKYVFIAKAKTKWAKERVKRYGSTFEFVREASFKNDKAVLVRELTFNEAAWFGWFTANDAEWSVT